MKAYTTTITNQFTRQTNKQITTLINLYHLKENLTKLKKNELIPNWKIPKIISFNNYKQTKKTNVDVSIDIKNKS